MRRLPSGGRVVRRRAAGRRGSGVGGLLVLAGVLGAAGEEPQVGRVLRELDRDPVRGAAARALGEGLLGDAVLERVVGQDGDPTTGRERVDRGGDRPLPDVELGVDLDPQRLEGALGRVSAAALRGRRDGLSQQLDEPGRGRERLDLALAEDGRGDPAGEPLLAVGLAGSARGRRGSRC